VIDDPYHPGERVVVAPALGPDVFLTHGAVADRDGNVVTTAGGRNDLLAAQCSRTTIVTVEALSEEPLTPARRPGWIFIPSFYVNAVVLAPQGSHPAEFRALYPADTTHLRRYIEAARSDDGFRAYLDEFVTGPADHQAYLEWALGATGAVGSR
ncbi:MAG: CoA-transferase, partial [Chloroflexota bacterium]